MLRIAIILLILWVIAWLLLKVAGFAIHILLVLALVAVIAHFVRGRGGSA
jgi:hypothetical protein